MNPKNLISAIEQKTRRKNEIKYDCHFMLSKSQTHRYIIVLGEKCSVITVMKIKSKVQRRFEKRKRNRRVR